MPAAAKPPMPAFNAATAALLLDEGEPEAPVEVVVVSLGCFVDVAAMALTPVPFVQTPGPGAGAELENVISAQLYSPPSGSPLVITWIVAFVPSVTFTPEGREKPVMQKAPNPCSVNTGLRMVLNAEPGSLPKPMTTSTFASMWLGNVSFSSSSTLENGREVYTPFSRRSDHLKSAILFDCSPAC